MASRRKSTLRSRAVAHFSPLALGLSLALVPAVLGPLRDAFASVSVAVSFDELVARSSLAVIVTPVSESSAWDNGRIVTYTELHVDALVAGEGNANQQVSVQTLGGVVDDIGQSVEGEPVFTMGRRSLLFLRPLAGSTYIVTTRGQGQFPIVLDAQQEQRLRRSAAVGATVSPRSKAPAATPLAADTLHGLKVSEATAAIVAAWSRLHAP